MLTPMMIEQIKSLIYKHWPMTANLVISGLLSVFFFLNYLHTQQEHDLDMLRAILSTEVLVVSLYLTFKLLKNLQIEGAAGQEWKLFTQIVIYQAPLMFANVFAAVVICCFLMIAFLWTRQFFYLDLIEKVVD